MQLLQDIGTKKCRLTESISPDTKKLPKGVLGVLEGVCSDFTQATRNDNLYSRKLWQNVLDSEYVKESLETRTLFGALDHPETLENLAGDAAVSCTNLYIDEAEECLKGTFNVLPTPRGKILAALLNTGSILGVSCRGVGDLTVDSDGVNVVDPDTYTFVCFDVVTQPAAIKARQKYQKLTESQKLEVKPVLDALIEGVKQCKTVEDVESINRLADRLGYKDAPDFGKIIKEQLEIVYSNPSKMESEMDTLKKTNKKLQESNKRLQDDLEKAYKRVKIAESSMDRTNLGADISYLRTQIGKLSKTMIANSNEFLDKYTVTLKEAALLQEQNDAMKKQIKDFNAHKQDVQKITEQLKQRNNRITELVESVKYSVRFVQKCKDGLLEMEDMLQQEKTSNRKLLQDKDRLIKESKSIKAALTASKKDVKSLTQKLEESTRLYNNKAKQVDNLLLEYANQKAPYFDAQPLSLAEVVSSKSLEEVDKRLVESNRRKQPKSSKVMAARLNPSEIEKYEKTSDSTVLGTIFGTFNKK